MANLLTCLRLMLVVPVGMAMADADFLPPGMLALLLLLAIASDYFDGKVARFRGTASPAGQIFDHTTDFLFVTTGLAGAAIAGLVNVFLPLLIVAAFTQYVLDSHFFYREKQLHMSFLGRWNGILYFVPLCLIAASRLTIFSDLERFLLLTVTICGWGLLVSSGLSILDRALAPLREGRAQG